MFDQIIAFIKSLYPDEVPVPLHAPRFKGKEREYLVDCIDSTYVSYVGNYVSQFEDEVCKFTGARHAIAVCSGTAALHIALLAAGVRPGEEVITQPLTFVATANAIAHCGARPVFVDVEQVTLGLDPEILSSFLERESVRKSDGYCYNKHNGRRIGACVPVHTFGHPARIDKIVDACGKHGIPLVEDSAEGLGSFYKGRHVGTFGLLGIFSFNGNKPVTTGGGGMVITNDDLLGQRVRYLTTTAKEPHPWEFIHNEVGYNYRLPNVNAAVGCAQMEWFTQALENKRLTAGLYQDFFERIGVPFVTEPDHARSNYWLNAITLEDHRQRDEFLRYASDNSVQARPVWRLMSHLPMFKECQTTGLHNAEWLEERVINLPSSVRL
ncbi:MAG: LegC family aminotransferase [Desulfobacteraceae bacterium]|nr:MAG: LegC family aminotransferase [Desulfobacteraceae bacterium]